MTRRKPDRLHAIALALVLSSALAPASALAASTFYGIVRHVSVNDIKVYDPSNRQTRAFEIVPKFDRVFSKDGKTTFQMKNVKPGRYVGIIYDQKALGIRHADKIYLLNNANDRIASP